MEFVNLSILPTPPSVTVTVDEQAKSYKGYRVVNTDESGPVSVSSYAPDGNTFAVAQSTRLSLWEMKSMKMIHQFDRFKELVTACSFRSDGKLLLAGDASGKTSVLNLEGKSTLKRLTRHRGAVSCCGFGLLRANCITGGNDKTVRYWDIANATEISKWDAHKDGVQCMSNSPLDEMVFATGSHDGCVKLWDLRAEAGSEPTMTLDHGHPVESICYFPSAMMLASAGSTIVNIWDLSKGSIVATLGESHARTITSCSVDTKGEICFTTSLDGTAKVWDASTYRMIYSYEVPKPALSGQWSPGGNGCIVGLDNGWQARRSKLNVERAEPKKRPKMTAARFYKRGRTEKPQEGDAIVATDKLAKQSSTDYFLRKFEHKKALVSCVMEGPAAKVWTFLDEMMQRGSLEKCLKELDQAEVLSLLQWILRQFPPEGPFRLLFFDFVDTLLDQDLLLKCASPSVVDMITRIKSKVQEEIGYQHQLKPLLGVLDSVLLA